MPTYTWQKSSYCGQGESCVHVAATAQSSYCAQGQSRVHISTTPEPPQAIHLTESADPAQTVLTSTPTAFAALLQTLAPLTPSPC